MIPEYFRKAVANPVVLLITPPLMQPNTPYPATPLLTGFLKSKGYTVFQADLGIELLRKVFSSDGLIKLFNEAEKYQGERSRELRRLLALRQQYIDTIGPVMAFLTNPTTDVATRITGRDWLPESSHFQTSIDLDWAFGSMGIIDKSKFLITRYLQDISDMITQCVAPHFSLIHYGERLSVSLPGFDPMLQALQEAPSLPDQWLIELLDKHMMEAHPDLVGFSVPFPGNLYGGLRCCAHLRSIYPEILTILGGGYPTTELRRMTDARLFDFVHLVSLDDGFEPLQAALLMLQGQNGGDSLPSCAFRQNGKVVYTGVVGNGQGLKFAEIPAPDYSALQQEAYFPLLDTANLMHRLWSDGRWNKLTLAHGCYWHGCAFCDTSLKYIRQYDPSTAIVVVDTMERVMAQTGSSGFHFTDEAAPPVLLRDVSLEILRRGLQVSWWSNIRFERAFNSGLCILMAKAGCIAVTGGIETASARLLKLMNKGVTIEQAAQTCRNFTQAGIMVHAYLMYGFPTQTVQETIDSLEIVRQMFESGIIQSGFWHRFALTEYSPVSLNPGAFGIMPDPSEGNGFANNEIFYTEQRPVNHDQFGEGLRTSLFNFMQGVGFDVPVNKWFGTKQPGTRIKPDLIAKYCSLVMSEMPGQHRRIVWPGYPLSIENNTGKYDLLWVETPEKSISVKVPHGIGEKLLRILTPEKMERITILLVSDFVKWMGITDDTEADLLWTQRWMIKMREAGLLIV
ncbi:MAG: hypothetical protein A2X11_03150 [Bacteroidetes bacterium GWE2_42_24]|nr:MAG: hypothetical protein A2X11_03150 [Bacteroidetes bacterium GWE2_42_24]OFY30451.1 MAG: hypothetical protein A2X09_12690 [Bacteroidetes bacterium GWF2_43_11]